MKIWSIKFDGLFPVGSAAIVITRDNDNESLACELFRAEWKKNYGIEIEGDVTAKVLDCPPGAVHILYDGNY